MRLPKALRFGGRPWAVRHRRFSDLGAFGLCDYDSTTLHVASGQTPFNTQDTLLHESLHALLADAPFSRTPEEEERYVLFLSTRILGMFHENPEFATWLIKPQIK